MSQSTTSGSPVEAQMWAAQMAEHERLVRWVVCRQRLRGLPFEEAVQEGRIGLWQALRRYDPSRGTTLSTYAVPAIAHAIWRAVHLHHRWPAPGDLPTAGEESEPVEIVHRAQVYASLRQQVNQMPPRLRQVVIAHYGLDDQAPQTFAALGITLGLTRQRIQQLHVEALRWLAHPAHSLPLRRLLDRHQRTDYQRALTCQRHYLRRRRRPVATTASSAKGVQA